MTYEINLNAITDELVETYSRLLRNDVCIADIYRDRAIENFKGTVQLLMLIGRIKDDEKAFEYIDILEDRLVLAFSKIDSMTVDTSWKQKR